MNTPLVVLTALALLAAAVAIFNWIRANALAQRIDEAGKARADAESERRALAEKVESLEKRFAGKSDALAKLEREARETKATATSAKEELKKAKAAVERAESAEKVAGTKLRGAEASLEELRAVLAETRKELDAARRKHATPPPAETPPPVRKEREPTPEDEKLAARRAAIEAEKEERREDRSRERIARLEARIAELEGHGDERFDKLRADRKAMLQRIVEQEAYLRTLQRQAEHNRRAYIVTQSQLDLLEDRLYILKHGTARPEHPAEIAEREARLATRRELEDKVLGPKTAADEADAAQTEPLPLEIAAPEPPVPLPLGEAAAAPEPPPEVMQAVLPQVLPEALPQPLDNGVAEGPA